MNTGNRDIAFKLSLMQIEDTMTILILISVMESQGIEQKRDKNTFLFDFGERHVTDA